METVKRKISPWELQILKLFHERTLITDDAYEGVIRQFQGAGGLVDELIMERGAVDEQALLTTIATAFKTKFVTAEQLRDTLFKESLLARIPVKVARQLVVFPVAFDEATRALTIVTPFINDLQTIAEVERVASARSVRPFVAWSRAVKMAIDRWYEKKENAFNDLYTTATYEKLYDVYGKNIMERVPGDAASVPLDLPAVKGTGRPSAPDRDSDKTTLPPTSLFTCVFCDGRHPVTLNQCPESGQRLGPLDKLSGRTIDDKYRIKAFIGKGGMGVVHEIEHMAMGKKLAIKFLNPEACKSQESYERFKAEAKAAAMIAHKNIVDVVDIGTTEDGLNFIIMEYLSGEDLSERLEAFGRILPREAGEILAQVLEALGAVHSCGIVHRDLKPENIFLARQSGGSEIVKILDFGISKIAGAEAPSMRYTRAGCIYGTPQYLSPEQAEGKVNIDHRADLYTAGVIFYEMLTGTVPFTADYYGNLLVEILTKAVPDPQKYLPDMSEGTARFLATSLEKSPDKRFQSAAEMLAELRTLDLAFGAVGTSLPPPASRKKAECDRSEETDTAPPSPKPENEPPDTPLPSPEPPGPVDVREERADAPIRAGEAAATKARPPDPQQKKDKTSSPPRKSCASLPYIMVTPRSSTKKPGGGDEKS